MKAYFTDCKTAEDLKLRYKKLAKQLHPDCNPGRDTTAEFQSMQAEFEKAWEQLKSVHVDKDGKQYNRETDESAKAFMDMVNTLIRVPGLIVEICGSWIWVTGDTKNARDTLKKLKLRWSAKKQAWYFHFGTYRKKSKKNMSLDDIRHFYGSQVVELEETTLSA